MSKKAAKKAVKKVAKKVAKKIAKKATKASVQKAHVIPQPITGQDAGGVETPSSGKELPQPPLAKKGIPAAQVLESKPVTKTQSPPRPQPIPVQEIKPASKPQPIPIQEIKPASKPQPIPVQEIKPASKPQPIPVQAKKSTGTAQPPTESKPKLVSETVKAPTQDLSRQPQGKPVIQATTQISVKVTRPSPKTKQSKLSAFKRNLSENRGEIIKLLNKYGWMTALIGGGLVLAMGIAGTAVYGSDVLNSQFGLGILDIVLGCCGVAAGVLERVFMTRGTSLELSPSTVKMRHIWTGLGCACYGVGAFIFVRFLFLRGLPASTEK
jgi:hypothetical protein